MTVSRYGHLRSAPVVVDACLRTEWEPPTLRAALCELHVLRRLLYGLPPNRDEGDRHFPVVTAWFDKNRGPELRERCRTFPGLAGSIDGQLRRSWILYCPRGLWVLLRCATLILRLSCALAPSRESDARLQSAQNLSSSLRSSHAHRFLPFLSVSSSWPLRPGTLSVHSRRALVLHVPLVSSSLLFDVCLS